MYLVAVIKELMLLIIMNIDNCGCKLKVLKLVPICPYFINILSFNVCNFNFTIE